MSAVYGEDVGKPSLSWASRNLPSPPASLTDLDRHFLCEVGFVHYPQPVVSPHDVQVLHVPVWIISPPHRRHTSPVGLEFIEVHILDFLFVVLVI